jgi:hypothetical protein
MFANIQDSSEDIHIASLINHLRVLEPCEGSVLAVFAIRLAMLVFAQSEIDVILPSADPPPRLFATYYPQWKGLSHSAKV